MVRQRTLPGARFSLSRLRPNAGAPGRYTADGLLTVKNIERPIQFQTQVRVDAASARAQGTVTIARSDFRLRDVVLEAVVPIGDDVHIGFDLVARKAN